MFAVSAYVVQSSTTATATVQTGSHFSLVGSDEKANLGYLTSLGQADQRATSCHRSGSFSSTFKPRRASSRLILAIIR